MMDSISQSQSGQRDASLATLAAWQATAGKGTLSKPPHPSRPGLREREAGVEKIEEGSGSVPGILRLILGATVSRGWGRGAVADVLDDMVGLEVRSDAVLA